MSQPEPDWLDAYLTQEGLPEAFRRTVDRVCTPLADRSVAWWGEAAQPIVIGLCGAQGCGKSTIAAATVRVLERAGLKAVALSIDDFYLSRAGRARVAERINPLLRVRGVPSTHDLALAHTVLDALPRPGVIALPAFDKAIDEREPERSWRRVEGPVDVVILEGWCVGARPEPKERVVEPLNALERKSDPTQSWRNYVNRQLAGPYAELFARLDRLVLLKAPGFEVVQGWRTEQEAKLRTRTGGGMSDAEVGRFVQHYERLTRWILEEMPDRADWVFRLSADRTPLE